MALAGQVHACHRCARRLPVDNVVGSVVVICPKCKETNLVQVLVATRMREVC